MAVWVPAGLLLTTLSLSACGDNSGNTEAPTRADTGRPANTASTSGTPTGSASGSAQAGGSPQDQAAVTANFTRFFDTKTPQSEAITLLQNGPVFATVIAEQAASPQSKGSSVSVSKVNVISPDKATVTFSVLINGQPVLPNQGGWAVKQDGRWKVAAQTFCGLVSMGGPTPAACADPKNTALPD